MYIYMAYCVGNLINLIIVDLQVHKNKSAEQ